MQEENKVYYKLKSLLAASLIASYFKDSDMMCSRVHIRLSKISISDLTRDKQSEYRTFLLQP